MFLSFLLGIEKVVNIRAYLRITSITIILSTIKKLNELYKNEFIKLKDESPLKFS